MISRRTLVASGTAALTAAALAQGLPLAAPDPSRLKGMIFGKGPSGHFDDKALGMCTPYWSAEQNRWMMWYYGRDRSFSPDAPETLTTGRIGLATSRDGVHWDRYNGPGVGGAILEPSAKPHDFDSLHIGLIDVKYIKGSYWMWYFGGDHTPSMETNHHLTEGYRMRPGLARSQDGVTWSKVRGPGPGGALFDYEKVYAAWESVVHDGDRFVMYYGAADPSFETIQQRYAYSVDGVTWRQQGEIAWTDGPYLWDKQGIVMRHVQANPLVNGPRWLMVYAAVDGNPASFKRRSIGAAVSDDGVHWRHLYDQPIFRISGEGNWDHQGVSGPRLVKFDNQLRLYYYGYSPLTYPTDATRGLASPMPAGLGLAISTTGDLRDVKRIEAV